VPKINFDPTEVGWHTCPDCGTSWSCAPDCVADPGCKYHRDARRMEHRICRDKGKLAQVASFDLKGKRKGGA